MVQKNGIRRANFVLFVAPALLLYSLFFLLPFGQGLRISITNWDGLTPKTPISMEKDEFETRILAKVSGPNREFLLSVYKFDESAGQYARLSISGIKRYRLEWIVKATGYSPEMYKDVGLKNYRAIFDGKVDERFYPRVFEENYFNPNASLPQEIEASNYERNFLSKLDAGSATLAEGFYARKDSGGAYLLSPVRDEFVIEDALWTLPRVESGSIDSSEVDDFLAEAKKAGLSQDSAALNAAIEGFEAKALLTREERDSVSESAQSLFEIGRFKKLLATTWKAKKFDMGVIGFTVFFALGNVIFANLLAFWIAMALDRKLKSRNILRSVFFLPNVLSMIVVALVWSFIFFHLLPKLTGIGTWMSDSAKAPWLLVFVSVWQASGYYMVVYLAGLQNIPQDVIEAAMIDGAGFGDRLKRITLPLLMPAFTVCIFLSIANALKCFDLVYAMVGPSGYAVGTVPFVMDIFFDAFARKLAGLATAKATLLFLTILLVTGIQLIIMKRKEVQL
ncbi:MAG TPA: sugar ABC transporter permease [Rectinemataceae bacterium]|nr:sugar ABC transporter permease [Rectinemataceae bacterium]